MLGRLSEVRVVEYVKKYGPMVLISVLVTVAAFNGALGFLPGLPKKAE